MSMSSLVDDPMAGGAAPPATSENAEEALKKKKRRKKKKKKSSSTSKASGDATASTADGAVRVAWAWNTAGCVARPQHATRSFLGVPRFAVLALCHLLQLLPRNRSMRSATGFRGRPGTGGSSS